MKNIRVNNKKGITILYALLGILVFTMVSIVIFNAATSNYARYLKEHNTQQTYITVSDAVNVFIDSVAGDKVNFENKEVGGVVTPSKATDWNYVDNGSMTPKSNSSSDYFSSILLDLVKQRYNNSTATISKKFKIEADFDGDEDTLEAVYIDLSLNNYDIVAVFSNYDGTSEEPEDVCYMTVVIPFVRDEDNSYKPVIETKLDIDTDASGKKVVTSLYKVEWDKGNVKVTRGK